MWGFQLKGLGSPPLFRVRGLSVSLKGSRLQGFDDYSSGLGLQSGSPKPQTRILPLGFWCDMLNPKS